MSQLRQDYLRFVSFDAEVVVIGPESPAAFARYWQREELPFIGLPDPDHRVANLYGQQIKLLKFGRLPALMVIDKSGHICYRYYGDSMKDIVANTEILSLLKHFVATEV